MKVGFKENQEDVIFLDVVIFGANMNFVGFVEKNMSLLIIEIPFQCVLVYQIAIIREKWLNQQK